MTASTLFPGFSTFRIDTDGGVQIHGRTGGSGPPQMLRLYFLHHRKLLGVLCQAGWEVVRELMVTATGDRHLQPGMVAVIQTSGDVLGWHPHAHALASRGGWDEAGGWVPVPFVDATVAERLFRHRVRAATR